MNENQSDVVQIPFDLLLKYIKRRYSGVFSGIYYNIIIPALKDSKYTIEFEGENLTSLHRRPLEVKQYKFTIRDGFPDTFDEFKIKHGFHKAAIKVKDQTIDFYINNTNKGFDY